MHGSIDVAQFMQGVPAVEHPADERQEFLDRQRRDYERREEHAVLRSYHQADPAARRTIVEKNRAVFDRITANRHRAQSIAHEEREAADRYYLARGYLIRPRGIPRYVRPDWSGVIAGELRANRDKQRLPKSGQ